MLAMNMSYRALWAQASVSWSQQEVTIESALESYGKIMDNLKVQ